MPKDADRSRPPTVFEVLRTAAIWFAVGALGTVLMVRLLYVVLATTMPPR